MQIIVKIPYQSHWERTNQNPEDYLHSGKSLIQPFIFEARIVFIDQGDVSHSLFAPVSFLFLFFQSSSAKTLLQFFEVPRERIDRSKSR